MVPVWLKSASRTRDRENLRIAVGSRHNFFMASSSYLRLTKSETRELADREYRSRFGKPEEWHMSNGSFFTAFVVIAALVAVFALVLR
jgi:hypothetical protein